MTGQADRRSHWENVYTTRDDTEVSWFEAEPGLSLQMIAATGLGPAAPVIDIGGGASRLADALLARGYRDITVLDLSEAALARARQRLGPEAEKVTWIAADVTGFVPQRRYRIWHDRAALHFLTEPADQAAYVGALNAALEPGGQAILMTFAPGGPEKCSGLTVQQHDAASLSRLLGKSFALVESVVHDHLTPAGRTQRFQASRFRRL